MAIQKRDREMVIGTYGRGIYVADIAPIKEFKPETSWPRTPISSIPRRSSAGTASSRRGETVRRDGQGDNPPVGATIYYYLKGEPKAVKLVVKDLEGTVMQELGGTAKKGLQKASWNLTKRAEPSQQGGGPGGPGGPGGGRRGGRLSQVDNGVYKVTLNVDGKDVATKTVKLSPDPLFK